MSKTRMQRRDFLKTGTVGLGALALAPSVLKGAAAEKRKPNIIVIMADDISAKEFPTYGIPNPTYKDAPCATPVMERMKNEGVQFKHAWATPLCHPTRGMIMTGRYAYRTRWWSNEFTPAQGEKGHSLYDENLVFSHIAKKAGYACQMVGKWQLGGTFEGHGFDEYVMTPAGSYAARAPKEKKMDGTGQGKPSFYWNPGYSLHNHPDYPESSEKGQSFPTTWDDFAPDIELKYIKDFIRRKHRAEQPFFVYWAAHLGHKNWDFEGDRMDYPGVPARDKTGKWIGERTGPGLNHHVEYLDYCFGEIIRELEALGIRENTIILFTTDNGTTEYGKGLKGCVKEKGAKVPMIIWGPGIVKARGEADELTDLADITPTIAELTGAPLPDGYTFDGQSLVPFLIGEAEHHRDWIYSYNAEYQMVRTRSVVRDGLGMYWDTRGVKEQEDYREIGENRDPELRKDIELIERVLKRFPTPDLNTEMFRRYLREKAQSRANWEKLKERILGGR